MPFRDGTGPQGQGPLTGRGVGPCGDGRGFGFGRGFGKGFGRGFRFWDRTPTKEEQKQDLENYKKSLEAELKAVKEEQDLFDEKR